MRVDANDYSVHMDPVGRRVQVTADLDQVPVTCARRLVAHPTSVLDESARNPDLGANVGVLQASVKSPAGIYPNPPGDQTVAPVRWVTQRTNGSLSE